MNPCKGEKYPTKCAREERSPTLSDLEPHSPQLQHKEERGVGQRKTQMLAEKGCPCTIEC